MADDPPRDLLETLTPPPSLLLLAEPPLGEDDEDKDLEPPMVAAPKAAGQASVPSDTDITAEFLQPLLTPENVANLVRGWGGGALRGVMALWGCSGGFFFWGGVGSKAMCPPRFFLQVLISMVYLPEAMPASFQATYTPVESAGTEAQIKHLARLMATQMTAAGLGPGKRGLVGGCARPVCVCPCPPLSFPPWQRFSGCSARVAEERNASSLKGREQR